MTECEMGGWCYRHSGREFEQTLRDREGQPDVLHAVHGAAESDTAEKLNNIVINKSLIKE